MNSIKKTIFLSNKQNQNFKGMATVTLEKKNLNIFGTIKTYNLDSKINYILGIKQNEKVYKQNIILDNNKYNFLISNVNDFLDNISCVLLSNENDKLQPLIWGSNSDNNYKSEIINNLQQNINKLKNSEVIVKSEKPETTTTTPNSKHNLYRNDYIKEDITTQETHSVHASKFTNENTQEDIVTPYHSEVAIASNYATLFDSNDDEIEKEIEKELNTTNTHQFYEMIAEQLNELFDKYPHEEVLEKLIENSKWIKIKNDNNKHYVVGIIYMDNDIKYICYGVPGNYSKEPPIELRQYSQWLPIDITNPFDNGYWVMYQDADSGENIILQ